MKKLFLLLLLLPLLGRGLGGGLLSAQNVTVSNLVVTEGSPSTVTFDVSWERPSPGTVWMDSAWVFVDYNKNGVMARLPLLLSSGATLTDTSAPGEGRIEKEPGNTKGMWVRGYARGASGSFSAKVMLLTDATNIAGACAYASGYPPVGEYLDDTKLQFSGTPWYKIWLNSADGPEMIETGSLFFIPCGYTIDSFTDSTGAPGIFNCIRPATYTLSALPGTEVCVGTAVTLTLDGSESGWQYQLYNGTATVGSTVPGTDGALTFAGVDVVGGYSYTVRTVGGGAARCDMPVSNVLNVTVSSPPAAPTSMQSTVTGICDGKSNEVTLGAFGGSAGPGALYEWGKGSVIGSGSFAKTSVNACPVSLSEATTYWVRLLGVGACSATPTSGVTITIPAYPALSPGAITDGAAVTGLDVDPGVTITSASDATGGSGSFTYMWVRTGTSSATLTGSAATYTITDLNVDYNNPGTYAFNRYVKDGKCSSAWVASAGTYMLTVLSVMADACPQCCYNGEAWVDCHVSGTAGYNEHWSGNALTYYPGAVSSKNGRANTAAIPSSTTTANAVQTCKILGEGWYLPAYEELYIMFYTAGISYVNHWSSTEWFDNDGSYKATNGTTAEKQQAVIIDDSGGPNHAGKTDGGMRTLCAWRPPDPMPAASTLTWTMGTLTWSDRIVAEPGNCAQLTTLSANMTSTPPAEYKISSGRYYYNWPCAYINRDIFCPAPWRLPNPADAGSFAIYAAAMSLDSVWGYAGWASQAGMYGLNTRGILWSQEDFVSSDTYFAYYVEYSSPIGGYSDAQRSGMEVRCVRED